MHDHLNDHIDALFAANPTVTAAAVWEHLVDHHHHVVVVSYGTIRSYLAKRKPEQPPIAEQP